MIWFGLLYLASLAWRASFPATGTYETACAVRRLCVSAVIVVAALMALYIEGPAGAIALASAVGMAVVAFLVPSLLARLGMPRAALFVQWVAGGIDRFANRWPGRRMALGADAIVRRRRVDVGMVAHVRCFDLDLDTAPSVLAEGLLSLVEGAPDRAHAFAQAVAQLPAAMPSGVTPETAGHRFVRLDTRGRALDLANAIDAERGLWEAIVDRTRAFRSAVQWNNSLAAYLERIGWHAGLPVASALFYAAALGITGEEDDISIASVRRLTKRTPDPAKFERLLSEASVVAAGRASWRPRPLDPTADPLSDALAAHREALLAVDAPRTELTWLVNAALHAWQRVYDDPSLTRRGAIRLAELGDTSGQSAVTRFVLDAVDTLGQVAAERGLALSLLADVPLANQIRRRVEMVWLDRVRGRFEAFRKAVEGAADAEDRWYTWSLFVSDFHFVAARTHAQLHTELAVTYASRVLNVVAEATRVGHISRLLAADAWTWSADRYEALGNDGDRSICIGNVNWAVTQ